MVSTSVAELGAVETKDGDGEDKLQEAQGQISDDEWQRLAAGDSGGGFLVKARECHGEGGKNEDLFVELIKVEYLNRELRYVYLTLPYITLSYFTSLK